MVLPLAPVLCWIVPPDAGVPVPVTMRPPSEPVVSRLMPTPALSVAVPAVMLWNVRSSAWIVVLATLSAVPVVVVSVLFGAVAPLVSVTAMVPPPVALKAVLAPVEALMPPSKRMVAPVLPVRSMPPPLVEVRLALKSTVPPVRPVISIRSPAVVLVTVALMVTLAAPPLMSTPMPAGSLVAPMVPPLMVTVPGELVMSMPSPVWPSRSTLPMVSDPDMPLRLMPSAPPLEVTVARVAFSVVGLISSAVPLLEVIWLVPLGSGC